MPRWLPTLFGVRVNWARSSIVARDVDGGIVQHIYYGQEKRLSLTLPWSPLPEELGDLGKHDVFVLLQWHSRLTRLIGRDREIVDLLDWARGGPGLRARLVFGEGDVGKSRLAAEIADTLRREGWAAGTLAVDDARLPPDWPADTLLILDYPEERRGKVDALLRALAQAEPPRDRRSWATSANTTSSCCCNGTAG